MMNDENTRPLLMMLVLGFTVFLGAGAFYSFRTGAFATPLMPAIFGVVVLLGIIVIGAAIWKQSSREKSKPKHDMDMYEVIDRLVENLNEDEANYLWRKLNAADRQETAESLTALLDEREQQKS
jgi:hypothetical protein